MDGILPSSAAFLVRRKERSGTIFEMLLSKMKKLCSLLQEVSVIALVYGAVCVSFSVDVCSAIRCFLIPVPYLHGSAKLCLREQISQKNYLVKNESKTPIVNEARRSPISISP